MFQAPPRHEAKLRSASLHDGNLSGEALSFRRLRGLLDQPGPANKNYWFVGAPFRCVFMSRSR